MKLIQADREDIEDRVLDAASFTLQVGDRREQRWQGQGQEDEESSPV